MCRLCLFDRESFAWLAMRPKDEILVPFLDQLEKSMGGDGNGVAALFSNGTFRYEKDVLLTTQNAAQWLREMYEQDATHFLFHTRIASIGKVCDENCHPHVVGETLLAHNGHDSQATHLARSLTYWREPKEATDSLAITALVETYGIGILSHLAGNFVGFHRGKPFAVVGDYSNWGFYCVRTPQGGILYTSEVPRMVLKSCYTDIDLNPDRYINNWTHYRSTETSSTVTVVKPKKHNKPAKEPALETVSEYLARIDDERWEEIQAPTGEVMPD